MLIVTKGNYTCLVWVPKNQHHRVSSKEQLADVSVLVDRSTLLGALSCLGDFRPHLLHVLQHHVAVSVEGLHTSEKLVVVSAINQDLQHKQTHGLRSKDNGHGQHIIHEARRAAKQVANCCLT